MDFLTLAALVGLGMLVWDCVEVGRNDAANLVNAVFGARVLRRRVAVMIAAVAVVLGATFASPVMETARKGIFDPTVLSVKMALAIYVSVYFVDTVLLYVFSGFGMPVSTTACLVFELIGASLFLAGIQNGDWSTFGWNIDWSTVRNVITAILLSILISGLASFMVMRVFRGAVRDGAKDRDTVLLHGPWISGAIFTWLTWFMVFKGLNNLWIIKQVKTEIFDVYGQLPTLLVLWGLFTLLVHLALVLTHRHGYKYLFSVTAVVGMICMAFAFGQNDLANAASPGLAGMSLRFPKLFATPQEGSATANGETAPSAGGDNAATGGGEGRSSGLARLFDAETWKPGSGPDDLAHLESKIPIPWWALFGCGVLMASGMFTQYAQRVTRAEVNTGSQFDHVALYAPRWCRALARFTLRLRPPARPLAPEPEVTEAGKKVHYDTLRASVITGVSASVIAFASGKGFPVSTTYVAFAAVLGSGFADRVFSGGDADLKVGRALWVISCWFLAPLIAVVATGGVALVVYHLSVLGLCLCLIANFGVRYVFKRRADLHEQKYHTGGGEHPAADAETD